MREILLKSKYWDNFNLDLYLRYLERQLELEDSNNNLNTKDDD